MARSADDLARITGKAKSNLSCALAIAAGSGLVSLKAGRRVTLSWKIGIKLSLWKSVATRCIGVNLIVPHS